MVIELLNQDTLCPRKSILSLSSCSTVRLSENTVLTFGVSDFSSGHFGEQSNHVFEYFLCCFFFLHRGAETLVNWNESMIQIRQSSCFSTTFVHHVCFSFQASHSGGGVEIKLSSSCCLKGSDVSSLSHWLIPQVCRGRAHLSVSDPAEDGAAVPHLCESGEHRRAQRQERSSERVHNRWDTSQSHRLKLGVLIRPTNQRSGSLLLMIQTCDSSHFVKSWASPKSLSQSGDGHAEGRVEHLLFFYRSIFRVWSLFSLLCSWLKNWRGKQSLPW